MFISCVPSYEWQLCVGAAISGVLSHLLFFIHGEHHRAAGSIALFYLTLIPMVFYAILRTLEYTYCHAVMLTGEVVLSYFLPLTASIFIYRIFFHRLRKFRGPFLIKLSKLYHVWLVRNLRNFEVIDGIHRSYGEFVRTGPNEVSITAPGAVTAVFAPGSKCTKAPWYDMTLPAISLQQTRSKALHDTRRRVWDRAFSAKALRDYEDRVEGYASKLVEQISERSGQPINVKDWFNFFSFDIMGDLAFGKSFDMLKSGKHHDTLTLLHEGTRPVGFISPIPWAFRLFANIPRLGSSYKKFQAFCKEQAIERRKMNVDVPDIMTWLLKAEKIGSSKGPVSDEELLIGDSRLIIIAGSDTTATTLTHIFYYLARHPWHTERLREELNPILASSQEHHPNNLQTATHLNGVINEALRLHPPVPSGVLRLSPAEGLMIDGTYIPGNTTISVPPYTIGRSEKCFVQPEEFIPERWYSKPELIKEPRAFAPFSLGPYACIGKQLALMEIRAVVTKLVTRFDVKFVPGEDGTRLLKESVDIFTLGMQDLNLIFEDRKI